MEYKEFMEKWSQFTKTFPMPDNKKDTPMGDLIKRYTEQNLEVLNDILSCSTEYLRKLNNIKSPEEIAPLTTQFTTELGTKMVFNSQKFSTMFMQDMSKFSEWNKKK